MRLAKGGGSLAFIVNDTVFKVRKFHKHDNSEEKFTYEKMITDAIAPVLPVQVPHIDLIWADEYLFYKTKYIKGRVLMDLPLKKIMKHNHKIGEQIGHVMYKLFNTDFKQLKSIKQKNANKLDCGLTHGDMCSNIIVDPKTMDVVGIIDWEYAGYSSLMREFFGIFRVRRKMRKTDIAPIALKTYWDLTHAKKAE
ncbi:MAG: phosphotransferase [Alphaproteobacteria bacterium]|nr:phosphotransferase [Alphaproteobacteria bacterium]